MDDREQILWALPKGDQEGMPPAFHRHRTPSADLWFEFEERLAELGGQVLPGAVLPLILNRGGAHWADEDVRPLLPATGRRAETVWDAEVGFCLGDLAIAETGSILIAAGPGRSRLASLAPPVNVLLVKEASIVSSWEEAIAQTPDRTTVIVTGPSRTADIEGVLVRGVHGPRELYVIRI